MIIEIAEMALSYYLNKPRKDYRKDGMVLRALHELAAPSAGQLSVQMIQSAKRE